jgi:hypothetical protein
MVVPADEQLSLIPDGCCEVASVKRTFKLRNLLGHMIVMMIFNIPNITLHLNIFKISKHIRAQLRKSLKYLDAFGKQPSTTKYLKVPITFTFTCQSQIYFRLMS